MHPHPPHRANPQSSHTRFGEPRIAEGAVAKRLREFDSQTTKQHTDKSKFTSPLQRAHGVLPYGVCADSKPARHPRGSCAQDSSLGSRMTPTGSGTTTEGSCAVDKLGFIGMFAQNVFAQTNIVGTGVPDGPLQRQSNFYKQMLDCPYTKP